MPLILGTIASAAKNFLWEPQGAYDSLATVTVPSGGVASVTFAGIPSGYKHLQIRALYKVNNTNSGSSRITYNGDSGNNYSSHYLIGDGSSASAGAVT